MGFQTLSKCKASVDINVNVVVYFDRLFCIATREVNIDKAAGGLRYAILHTIFHRSFFVRMTKRTYEQTPLP